jgi:hypothetical protein
MFEIEDRSTNTIRTVPENMNDVEVLQKQFPHLTVTDYGVIVKKETVYPVFIEAAHGIKE